MRIGTWEIILIVLVILLLFGGKKIPELMRGLGRGVKSFKEGLKDDVSEPANPSAAEASEPKDTKEGHPSQA